MHLMVNINVQILEYFGFHLYYFHIVLNKYLIKIFYQLMMNLFVIIMELFHLYL